MHRSYTQRGDIFINLYPDRLEVHSPGRLPLGVTPDNILHTSVKRNEHLAKVFYDLKLMEREGSGYDLIYDILLSSGKSLPIVQEGADRVTALVKKHIINPLVVDFLIKADQTFPFKQKERITLGLIAQHEALSASELADCLALPGAEELKPWLGRLVDWNIVKKRGRTKGTEYYVEPNLLRQLDFKGNTTLKGIETHRLRALLQEDLARYQNTSISEIHSRIGSEIPRRKLQEELKRMVLQGEIGVQGKKKWTRYLWTKNA